MHLQTNTNINKDTHAKTAPNENGEFGAAVGNQ